VIEIFIPNLCFQTTVYSQLFTYWSGRDSQMIILKKTLIWSISWKLGNIWIASHLFTCLKTLLDLKRKCIGYKTWVMDGWMGRWVDWVNLMSAPQGSKHSWKGVYINQKLGNPWMDCGFTEGRSLYLGPPCASGTPLMPMYWEKEISVRIERWHYNHWCFVPYQWQSASIHCSCSIYVLQYLFYLYWLRILNFSMKRQDKLLKLNVYYIFFIV
jgi:hypothetical protein